MLTTTCAGTPKYIPKLHDMGPSELDFENRIMSELNNSFENRFPLILDTISTKMDLLLFGVDRRFSEKGRF